MLQLAVGALKSFSGLRCAWISNLISALASSMFYFCFETWFVVEHEKVCASETLSVATVNYIAVPVCNCFFLSFSKVRSKICCLIPSG